MNRIENVEKIKAEVLPGGSRWTRPLFLFCLLFFLPASVFANNITLSSGKIAGWDTEAHTALVQFDITWSNAWRDSTNYDSVWLFVKYTTDSGATWNHATLKTSGTNPSGFDRGSLGSSAEIMVPTDKKGCFIQFSDTSSGMFTSTGVQMVWDYGADGLSDATVIAVSTKVRVFGIEMVYIPAGSFYAGDETSTASFKSGSEDTTPWHITSEDAIEVTNIPNNGFYYTSAGATDESASGSQFTIPANFQKGFNAFYLMKYEMSQKQYLDFLNTLTRAQQNNRTASQTADYFAMTNQPLVLQSRNGIRNPGTVLTGPITFGADLVADTHFNEDEDGEWIAMNYISWPDLLAYADWAALRPMTELEYEKAARGSEDAVSGEYAWGDTNLQPATTILADGDTLNEVPNQGNLNYSVCSPDGPFRVGSFANSSSSRQGAGAGYYGNMELSGNVWERTVTVGNAAGRDFTGTHGDGVLTTTSSYEGNATNLDWPGIDETNARGVTNATGSGFRGGAWQSSADDARVSARTAAASANTDRDPNFGGRLTRTAPQS